MKLSVIIPVYNEIGSVGEVLGMLLSKKIEGVEIEILVVESNSTDGSREVVQSFGGKQNLSIILEEVPQGKGHAVRTGLVAATGDVILIQDADLEYSLDDYEKLLEPITNGRSDFVLGTRHTEGNWHMRKFKSANHLAFFMNLAHWSFTWLLNQSLKTKMSDPFTMFKVFRKSCIEGLEFECNRFDFDWELVIKLVRAGFKPLEIPISYQSRDFKEGKKVSMWKDPPMWMTAWFKYAILGK